MAPRTTKPREGFTKIPNAVIDNPNLRVRDKLVLIKIASHAYGDKTEAFPSQVAIAKGLGCRRETVQASIESLIQLGILQPHGKGGIGKQETFGIDLDRAANLLANPSGQPAGKTVSNLPANPASPAGETVTNKTAVTRLSNKAPKNDAVSLVLDGISGLGSSTVNRSCSAGVEVASDSVVPDGFTVTETVKRHCSAYKDMPANSSGSESALTKRQINEQLLGPNGKIPDDEPSGLLCNLDFELSRAGGNLFNGDALETLVAGHGPRYVAFWTSWLLRKIAAEYEAGRPVVSPSGLFADAVRGHWEVSPSWPDFDETKHVLTSDALDAGLYYDDTIPF